MQNVAVAEAESESPLNIVELLGVVMADGGWFLGSMGLTPTWTNKVDVNSAQRFPLTDAMAFVKAYRRRPSAMRVWVEPTI